MKETLQIIIEGIVNEKEKVSISENISDNNVTYEVQVAENDVGRVIGKEGKMAKSIRNIMKSIGAKNKQKVTVEFIGK